MKIEIEIGELVLHGFPAASRRQIAEAVERELARLACARPDSLGAAGDAGRLKAARLDAGPIELGPAAAPGQQGGAIARSVFAALGQAAKGEE